MAAPLPGGASQRPYTHSLGGMEVADKLSPLAPQPSSMGQGAVGWALGAVLCWSPGAPPFKERQNKPPAPCSVLFWPVLEHPQNKRVLFCSATRLHRGGPGEPGGRRGRGWARKRGPLGARPPSPGPRGSAEACGGGDQAKIRGLSDKICSAGGRSLAICAPSAQSARRRH